MLPFHPKFRTYAGADPDVRRAADEFNKQAQQAIEWIEGKIYDANRIGYFQFGFDEISEAIGAPRQAVHDALPHQNRNGITFWVSDEALSKIRSVVLSRRSIAGSTSVH